MVDFAVAIKNQEGKYSSIFSIRDRYRAPGLRYDCPSIIGQTTDFIHVNNSAEFCAGVDTGVRKAEVVATRIDQTVHVVISDAQFSNMATCIVGLEILRN